MAWIDSKKAYIKTLYITYLYETNILRHTCFKICRIPGKVIMFIQKSLETQRVEFTAGEYMDDIKLFAKNERESEALIQT